MTDIEKLIASEEIKQTKARYFRCMDTKDWDGFTAVFTPDATVDYTPAAVDSSDWKASGAANCVALVRSVIEKALSIHHGHMAEVEVTSPTAAKAIFAMEDLIPARRLAAQDDARLGALSRDLREGQRQVADQDAQADAPESRDGVKQAGDRCLRFGLRIINS